MANLKQFFQNLGKAPSQIHSPNIYEQSLAETKAKGLYEASARELAPTTYQQANLLSFQFAKGFTIAYHFVSALLGLVTVILLAYFFSGAGAVGNYPAWLIYILFGLVFFILTSLLIGIEIFKRGLCKSIFKKTVIGEKVNARLIVSLILVMLISISISAIGGYVLSYTINDKTTSINQTYTAQADSLARLHKEALEAVNASIEAYRANLNKGSYWARYQTRQDLNKAISQRNEILANANNQQQTINLTKEKEISLNTGEGTKYGLISAIFILCLELLSIFAYWYQYSYHANCEKEAVNFEILPTHQPQNKTDLQEIKEVLQGINQTQLASSTINTRENKVGFTFGNTTLKVNGEGNTVKVDKEYIQLNTNERVCKHCNSKFTFKHWNATYCSERCKIEAWEKRTGRTFAKKKSLHK